MKKGSNRILAYKLASTVYNLNLHNITTKLNLLNSESTNNIIHADTVNKELEIVANNHSFQSQNRG